MIHARTEPSRICSRSAELGHGKKTSLLLHIAFAHQDYRNGYDSRACGIGGANRNAN